MSDQKMLTLVMDRAFIERIDDFRFARRFASRAEAIRWLLDWALDHAPDARVNRA